MDTLLRGELTESISTFEQILEKIDSTNSVVCASVYCNIAIAEFELQLYRKCIGSCSKSIECDKNYLRAYIMQGHAQKKLNKEKQALAIWQRGLTMVNSFSDLFVVLELKGLLGQSNSLHSIEQLFYHESNPGNNFLDLNKNIDHSIPKQSKTISLIPTQMPNMIQSSDLSAFQKIYEKYVLHGKAPLNPTLIEAVRLNLSHSTGERVVDDVISAGYLYVNTSHFDEAIEIFMKLIEVRPTIIAAYLGMGSAFALINKFDEAISSFTSAIALDPTVADAWKRRGQTRGAKNLLVDSIIDLTRALELHQDSDTFMQRGIIYHKSKNYQRSLLDFRQAQRLGESSASLWNYIGMCEGQLGNINESLEGYRKAIELEPEFKEACLNYAQMLKEIGNGEQSQIAYQQLINQKDLCNDFPHVYSFRATLFIGQGKHREAIEDLKKAIAIYVSKGKVEPQLLALIGTCYHALGQFSYAHEIYQQVLEIDGENSCWGNSLVMLVQWSILDSHIEYINLDKLVSPYVKEACSKKLSKRAAQDSGYRETLDILTTGTPKDVSDLHPSAQSQESAERFAALLRSVSSLPPFVQLASPGFLRNDRQHRSFGVSVLQMAATLRQHVLAVREGGGLRIPHSRSSSSSSNININSSNGNSSSGSGSTKDSTSLSYQQVRDTDSKSDSHVFGYRDLLDIAVLWRQVVEPSDCVWWIDGLTRQAFQEGFGLQTPVVNGQLKTIRYYTYFPAAFRLTKDILLRDGYHNAAGIHEELSDFARSSVTAAETLQGLYEAIGKDFFVITKCHSKRRDNSPNQDQGEGQGNRLEGTRLTLVSHPPEGYEFTIRTAGTPERWVLLDRELEYCFDSIVDCLVRGSSSSRDSTTSSSCASPSSNLLEPALRLFYYWVNFAPLTRGSAACGYAALMAIMMAGGQLVSSALPPKIQLDWEAILEEDVDAFTTNAARFISLVDIPSELNTLNPSDCILTLRDMFKFLSI